MTFPAPKTSTTNIPIAKDASTVMLLRDGETGIEVFLVRRVKGMAFAGGMTVFPGGGVDPSDAATELEWAGPPPSWWGEKFGVAPGRAQALVCAAVRETFEECGVLLAGPTPDTVVADTTAYHDARERLERHEITFGEFLTTEKLVLRSDLLRPWAHWITPVIELRRYDTHFFVAVVPEGQIADGATSEAAEVMWRTPDGGIADWVDEQTMLMPPTWTQLNSLKEFPDTDAVLAAEPEIPAILPEIREFDGEPRLSFPNEEAYYAMGRMPDLH
ncbi:MAG: NUDIX domain-containing protein [Aldersonia sp.]|nr:NUDIX domain-containing protein [Aldersonia sp.]